MMKMASSSLVTYSFRQLFQKRKEISGKLDKCHDNHHHHPLRLRSLNNSNNHFSHCESFISIILVASIVEDNKRQNGAYFFTIKLTNMQQNLNKSWQTCWQIMCIHEGSLFVFISLFTSRTQGWRQRASGLWLTSSAPQPRTCRTSFPDGAGAANQRAGARGASPMICWPLWSTSSPPPRACWPG